MKTAPAYTNHQLNLIWAVLIGLTSLNLGLSLYIAWHQTPSRDELPEGSMVPEVFQQTPQVQGYFELTADKTTVTPNEDVTFTIKVGTTQPQPFNVAIAALQWNPADFRFKSETNGPLLGDSLSLPDASDPAWHRKVFTVIASTMSGGMNLLSANQLAVFKTVTLTAQSTIGNNAVVSLYHPDDNMPSIKFCSETVADTTTCTNLDTATTTIVSNRAQVVFNSSSQPTTQPTLNPETTPNPTVSATLMPTSEPEYSTQPTSEPTIGPGGSIPPRLRPTSRPVGNQDDDDNNSVDDRNWGQNRPGNNQESNWNTGQRSWWQRLRELFLRWRTRRELNGKRDFSQD